LALFGHFGSNFRPHEARDKPTRIVRYSDSLTVTIAAKFTDSAWLTAIVVQPAILLLRAIRQRYESVALQVLQVSIVRSIYASTPLR
jgi:hypothetical protein